MNPNPVCTQCGFTLAEFRARGLLGCPACYEQMGEALHAELLQLHPLLRRLPAASAAHGFPSRGARDSSPGRENALAAADVATLREQLGDALRAERYEEAAALRKRLDGPDALKGSDAKDGNA